MASQTVKPGNDALWGTWKAINDTTTMVMAFQSNGKGYSAYSPSYAKNPFTYSFSTPNRILISGSKFKPRRYSIKFITPNKVHFLTYPDRGEREEISILETVVFQRQSSPGTNSTRPDTGRVPK